MNPPQKCDSAHMPYQRQLHSHLVSPERSSGGRGFTVVELVVVVGIIMLLITLALVAFTHAQKASYRTKSASTLRNLIGAYTSYSADNNGMLLPGFVDGKQLDAWNMKTRLKSGNFIGSCTGAQQDCDDSSYVWRLAPYLDHAWETFITDYRSDQVEGKIAGELNNGIYGPMTRTTGEIGLSYAPSFGLNSLLLGGDNIHANAMLQNPWTPTNPDTVLAVTRQSQVKYPASLIVFAPTQHADYIGLADTSDHSSSQYGVPDVIFGHAELRPPLLSRTDSTMQWGIDNTTGEISLMGGDFTSGGGVLIARWGDTLPVARMDGSVRQFEIEELVKPIQDIFNASPGGFDIEKNFYYWWPR